ncbi:hypothetical protein RI543_000972 [Arxiozyma heterogenica]|uniref:Exocyst complex component Sec3 PIP2-binding N-terminal domain-containing protein n=1 Tax=Arxiozyma heterogenica TaxID=278026 RepID=A0AAN7ZT73_9SACH|nr:hypothetical protein RI543_000972 [Kazachstania heterogenica]
MKSAISPFKRKSHSRESSQDTHYHSTRQSQHSSTLHKRTISGSSVSNTHKRNISRSSNSSQGSNFLAEQYDRDRRAIIFSCFNKLDPKTNNHANVHQPNNYMTHVRIIEDAKYPSSRPGPDSKLEYKKKRILILSSLAEPPYTVFLHKARENQDGSFQIGRTWNFHDLTRIERDTEIPEGFLLTISKRYYWQTNSSKERTVFIKSLVKIFSQTFDGHVPELINWDLSMFYLDEKSYQRAVIHQNKKTQPTPTPNQSSSHPEPQLRPQTQNQPQILTNSNHTPNVENTKTLNKNDTLPPTDYNLSANVPNEETNTPNYKSLNRSPYTKHSTLNEVSRSFNNSSINANSSNIQPNNNSNINNDNDLYEFNQSNQDHPYHAMKKSYSQENQGFNETIDVYQTPRQEDNYLQNTIPYKNIDTEPLQLDNNTDHFDTVITTTTNNNDRIKDSTVPNRINDHLMEDLNAMLNIDNHNPADLKKPISDEMSRSGFTKDSSQEIYITPGNDFLNTTTTTTNNNDNNTDNDNDELDFNEAPRSVLNNDNKKTQLLFSDANPNEPYATPISDPSDTESVNQRRFRITNDDSIINDDDKDLTNENINNDLSFETGDEIRYSQTFEQPVLSPHQYHEVTTIQEEDHQSLSEVADESLESEAPTVRKQRLQKVDITDEILLEALTDVNWTVNDDADQLLARLNAKLVETEHIFNKDLLKLQQMDQFLESYEINIEQECAKMNPPLSMFLMDLNNLAQDIDFVERQDNGLQVESANKKLLWSTLSDLLNTVSLDETTLKELLKCPIRERNLPWMETQLSSLSKALKAINGRNKDDDNEDENDLRNMEAMKKRHIYYEKVTELFLARLVDEMGTLFSSINSDSTNEQLVSTLQRLLVYAPLICFCKEISSESYHTIVKTWNQNIQLIYNKLWSRTFKQVSNKSQNNLVSEKSVTQQRNLEILLSQWQHFKKTREFSVDDPVYFPFLSNLIEVLNFIQEQCIIYQNFVISFFHIKSHLSFSEYVAEYSDPSMRVVSLDKINHMDSDRQSASTTMNMVSKVFQPIISEFSSLLNDLVKVSSGIQPCIMLLLEERIKTLESSNQEFLYTAFKKLFVQSQNLWIDNINSQLLTFERIVPADFHKELLSPVFNFPILVNSINDSLLWIISKTSNMKYIESETYRILTNSYVDILSTIVKLLGEKPMSEKHSSVRKHLLDDSTLVETLTLLTNYNWLIELLTMLNAKLNGTFDDQLQQCKEKFDTERNIYAYHLLQNSMPKLKGFIDGATRIDENNTTSSVSLSQWGAYSRQNLEIILNSYTSDDIHKLVKTLYNHMMEDITIQQPEAIHISLKDKVWSTLQGQTVSLCLKLYTLVDKHYRGLQIRFNKNNIISSFEQYKE